MKNVNISVLVNFNLLIKRYLMKTYLIVALLYSSLLFTGCDPSFSIYRKTDKFQPNDIQYLSSLVTVKHSNPFDICEVRKYFQYEISGTKSRYFFIYEMIGDNWAFMEKVKILIDGKVNDFTPINSPTRDLKYLTNVREIMSVQISEEVIQKIAASNNIDVRIVGDKRDFEYSFDKNLKEKFLKFYNTVKNITD